MAYCKASATSNDVIGEEKIKHIVPTNYTTHSGVLYAYVNVNCIGVYPMRFFY